MNQYIKLSIIEKKILYNQIYYFSNIILVLTLLYGTRIRPLNYVVLFGSIFLFYIYPNYYEIIQKKSDRKLYYILLIADIIIHYIPIVYICCCKGEPIDWNSIIIICYIYLLLNCTKIKEIYIDIADDIKEI